MFASRSSRFDQSDKLDLTRVGAPRLPPPLRARVQCNCPGNSCRANSAQIRQSRPDPGLGVRVKVVDNLKVVSSSLGTGACIQHAVPHQTQTFFCCSASLYISLSRAWMPRVGPSPVVRLSLLSPSPSLSLSLSFSLPAFLYICLSCALSLSPSLCVLL